ncbi:unnamed protein product [Brassica oleracea var. botrytis]|uniref:(rape) hypothetical protein n=1 Tax=Brassica napus TaxID=3708 RepID=A0A816JGC4_BRANA|nr:unnamed protein product [Brassica napus]
MEIKAPKSKLTVTVFIIDGIQSRTQHLPKQTYRIDRQHHLLVDQHSLSTVERDHSSVDRPYPPMSELQAKIQCCLLGIGQLFPWNTILTISDYYYEIFPNYHPARILALVYQPFVMGTIFTLVSRGQKSKNQGRVLAGYCLFVIGTIFLITVDLVSEGKGGLFPFLLLCFIAASFGVANALVEGAMMGDLSCISHDLIQPFAAGLGIAGALTSGLSLLTKAVFQNSRDGLRKGALLFLAISSVIEFLCVVIYALLFPKLSIVQNYQAHSVSNQMETTEVSRVLPIDNLQLARENIYKLSSLFLTYAMTLSIFPGFLFENTGKHELNSWFVTLYVLVTNIFLLKCNFHVDLRKVNCRYPLVLITCFNVCDALSRYTTMISDLRWNRGNG